MIGIVLAWAGAYVVMVLLTNVVLSYIHARWHSHENWHDEMGYLIHPEDEIAWQSAFWFMYVPLLIAIFVGTKAFRAGASLSRWVISKTRPK